MKISIIGAGEIGNALGQILRSLGHTVEFWDQNPRRVPNQKSLADTTLGAQVVFFCVPSWAVRGAVTAGRPHLARKTVVVSLAKGLEQDTKQTVDQILEETLPTGQSFALLGGPLLAEELTLGLFGVGVFGTRKHSTFKFLQNLFEGAPLRLEWSRDPHLVALLGVLKNIYAIGFGIADGLGLGMNTKGWLVSRALLEIEGIIKLLHSKTRTAMQTAGVGDFIATAFSPYSKNREFGHQIVKTGTCDLKSEGCAALPPLVALLGTEVKVFPFLTAIYKIIYEKTNAKTVFEEFIRGA